MIKLKVNTNKNKSIIVDAHDKLEGSLRVGLTKEGTTRFVSFPYNLLETKRYAQKDDKDETISEFELKGFTPVKGWVRVNNSFFYNKELKDPAKYTKPVDGIPAYSICVGSDAYDKEYAANGRGYIPGGINLAPYNYIAGKGIKYGQGNDVISYVPALDGRTYSAQLCNIEYKDTNVFDGSRSWPILFYKDKGTDTWCQYFSPMDPNVLTDKFRNVDRIWSGSFYQFEEDTWLSEHKFFKGEVLYLFCSPSGSFDRTIFNVNVSKNDFVIFWAVAKDFDSYVHTGGVIATYNGLDGDPRMYFENGKLCYVSNGDGGITKCYFTRTVVNKLIENDKAERSHYSFRTENQYPSVKEGQCRPECPAPFISKGKKFFMYCSQILGIPGDAWNSIINNSWIENCNEDWTRSREPWLLDIGYDSYAVSASTVDDKVYWNTTAFSWAANQKPIKYPYTSGSYPWMSSEINEYGCLKHDVPEDYKKIEFNKKQIDVMRDGITKTNIKFDHGCYVDFGGTVLDEFTWKTSKSPLSKVQNAPVALTADEVKGVYYKVLNKYIKVIIKTVDNKHDLVFSCFFCKDGKYSIA